MRRVLLAALLLLLAPAAQACSLVSRDFADATWESGDLRFIDQVGLVEVAGGKETELAHGFFLSFAAVDGGLLVAGQDGLGSDCTGTHWLRWSAGGAVAWERSDLKRMPAVFAHADGPFVAMGNEWKRWADGDLHGTDWGPVASYALGVSADGGPVYFQDGQTVVSHLAVPTPDIAPTGVAHNATATALVLSRESETTLAVVSLDGTVQETRWAAVPGYPGVAWAEAAGWVVAAGGRAYLVAGGSVTDLGVEAVAVAARGPQPVAFQKDGYTVFSGTRAVEQWTRSPDGTWSATVPRATPSLVPATSTQESAGPAPPPAEPKGTPAGSFASTLAPLAALAVALARRRGRRPFEP